jgi:hypothetical protein
VTESAGISGEAQSHSATWWDFDNDGWPDLYVANDYGVPDKLYHNNRDGTFTNVIDRVLPHTSSSSMGSDLGDVNNDGLIDLLVADMAAHHPPEGPEDDGRGARREQETRRPRRPSTSAARSSSTPASAAASRRPTSRALRPPTGPGRCALRTSTTTAGSTSSSPTASTGTRIGRDPSARALPLPRPSGSGSCTTARCGSRPTSPSATWAT